MREMFILLGCAVEAIGLFVISADGIFPLYIGTLFSGIGIALIMYGILSPSSPPPAFTKRYCIVAGMLLFFFLLFSIIAFGQENPTPETFQSDITIRWDKHNLTLTPEDNQPITWQLLDENGTVANSFDFPYPVFGDRANVCRAMQQKPNIDFQQMYNQCNLLLGQLQQNGMLRTDCGSLDVERQSWLVNRSILQSNLNTCMNTPKIYPKVVVDIPIWLLCVLLGASVVWGYQKYRKDPDLKSPEEY